MKRITRLSLGLMMFALFSISYLVTTVSAQQGGYNDPSTGARMNTPQAQGGYNDPSTGAPATFDDGLMGAPAMGAPGTMGHNPAAGMTGGMPGTGAPSAAGMRDGGNRANSADEESKAGEHQNAREKQANDKRAADWEAEVKHCVAQGKTTRAKCEKQLDHSRPKN